MSDYFFRRLRHELLSMSALRLDGHPSRFSYRWRWRMFSAGWLADWLLFSLTHSLIFSSLIQIHQRRQTIHARKVHMASLIKILVFVFLYVSDYYHHRYSCNYVLWDITCCVLKSIRLRSKIQTCCQIAVLSLEIPFCWTEVTRRFGSFGLSMLEPLQL